MECSLKIIEVKNIFQALRVRNVRNECREFMTGNNKHISILQQIKWFYTAYLPNRKNMILYLGLINKQAVLYGFIRDLQTTPLLTGGIKKNFRHKGFGEVLFRFLTHESLKQNKGACLEVLATNENAFHLYRKIGFVETGQSDGIIKMNILIRRLGYFVNE